MKVAASTDRTALADLVKAIEDGMGSLDMWDQAYKAAKAALELPIDGPNWTQVSERLPMTYQTVILGKAASAVSPITGFWTGEKWVAHDVDGPPLRPTHWMELPDQPSRDATGILQGEKT